MFITLSIVINSGSKCNPVLTNKLVQQMLHTGLASGHVCLTIFLPEYL